MLDPQGMKLCDIMRPGPSTIADSDSLGAALRAMQRDRVRYLPVLRAGELVGILSERDILAARGWLEPGADWWTIEVRNAMHAPPQTATPDDSVAETATRMASANIGALPVVERGILLGIVSMTDVLDAEVRTAVPPRPASLETARARVGKGEVVDIEREVELGGPIHSKGVLILAGLIGARYAQRVPLSLSASIVFEQSYGGVEGDSASLAELCALLSAIADVPIKQALAVTGSVNQHGEIQPIGRVNEKIEGFFDVCRERGLTGEHGVLIPRGNVQHLMLRTDVIAAVVERRFHVHAVSHVDEAIALLTGRAAGARGRDGAFPAGSVNALAEARLAMFAEDARRFLVRAQER